MLKINVKKSGEKNKSAISAIMRTEASKMSKSINITQKVAPALIQLCKRPFKLLMAGKCKSGILIE